MSYKLELVNNHTTFLISPSQSEVIRTCPRQWLYRYLHGRVEREVDPAKQGGKSFDEALNLRYNRCGSQPCTPEVEAEQLALIDKAYEGVELPLEEFRTAARYKEVVKAYNQHWREEPFRVRGVQTPFRLVLGRVPVSDSFWIRYAAMQGMTLSELSGKMPDSLFPSLLIVEVQGIIDLWGELTEHNIVVDTKTSQNDIGSNYDNSAQMKCYMWALQELGRLQPDKFPAKVHCAQINGVIIRKPYKNSGRVAKENDKPRNDFVRPFPSFFSEERLEEWRLDTLKWVETALGWVADDHFPQNERACGFYMDAMFRNFGTFGKVCPYLQICSIPKDQRELALSSDSFMDHEKGPLSGGLTDPTA